MQFTFLHLRSYLLYFSLLLALIGLILCYVLGWSGFINLKLGESSNIVQVYERASSNIRGEALLPFDVQLNDFAFAKNPPRYEIQLLEENQKANDNPHDPKINTTKKLKAFSLEKQKVRQIPETKLYFRVNDFYPNFGFKYGYPEKIDTISPLDPGLMVELIVGQSRRQLQLRANENSTLEDPHINARLEFYWETPDDINDLVEYEEYSSQDSLIRTVFIGKSENVIYEFPKGIVKEKLEREKTYYFPHKENVGFLYQFSFPDPKFLTATPGSINQELSNPVAKLEIWQKDWDRSEFAYLYPPKRGVVSNYAIKGSDLQLSLGKIEESLKVYETNDLIFLDENGDQLLHQDIAETKYVDFKGYRFAQLKMDNESINYPGLSITYRKGINLLYMGLAGILLSVLSFLFGKVVPKPEAE